MRSFAVSFLINCGLRMFWRKEAIRINQARNEIRKLNRKFKRHHSNSAFSLVHSISEINGLIDWIKLNLAEWNYLALLLLNLAVDFNLLICRFWNEFIKPNWRHSVCLIHSIPATSANESTKPNFIITVSLYVRTFKHKLIKIFH